MAHEFAARDFHEQGGMQSSPGHGLVDVGKVLWREGEIFKRGTWEEIGRFWWQKVVRRGSGDGDGAALGEVEVVGSGEGSSVKSKTVDLRRKLGNVSWPSWAVDGQKDVCVLQAMVYIVIVTGGLLVLLVTMVFIKRWARSREMRKRSRESFGAMGEGAMRRYKLLSSKKEMPIVEQGRVCKWELDEEVGRGVCDGCGGGDGDWCGPRSCLEGKKE